MPWIFSMQNDISLSMSVNPFSGDLSLVREETAIKQSLYTLVKTAVYEKPFIPIFGNRLINSLFELFDVSLISQIRDDLFTLIGNFENRVVVEDIQITGTDNEIDIEILYYAKDNIAPQKLEISLKRTF